MTNGVAHKGRLTNSVALKGTLTNNKCGSERKMDQNLSYRKENAPTLSSTKAKKKKRTNSAKGRRTTGRVRRMRKKS